MQHALPGLHGQALQKQSSRVPEPPALPPQLVATVSWQFQIYMSVLITGFSALLHLGELSFPDDTSICDWRKITRHASVHLTEDHYRFTLSFHKADCLFARNEILG
jgi:hypothetical protein